MLAIQLRQFPAHSHALQLLQQLASEGVTNPTQDTRFIQGMQTIQQNALALQQQYITAAINEATSAGGAASANLSAAAQEQLQLDTNYTTELQAALNALGTSIGGVNVNSLINKQPATATP